MDNEKELMTVVEKGESERVEFKKSTAQMDRALKAMCSFLNHKGGVVYFGVSDKNELIGQDVSDSTLKTISQKIRQKIKPEVSPGINVLEFGGKKVVEVKVAKGTNKPYYLDGIAYKRAGSESPVIAPEELEKIILDKKKTYWDSEICEGAKLDDIDDEKVKWFFREARNQRGLRIPENASIRDILVRLHLLKDKGLTNAAVLLFGKEPHQFYLQLEVKCMHFHSTEVEKPFRTYQIYRGNIFRQVDDSLDFVLARIDRPVIPEPGKPTTKRPYEIPVFVIREAIVNAIAHREYSSTMSVQVMVFADRIEIWNPGKLPEQLGLGDLKEVHPSFPHNPLIAEPLYFTKYIEKAGSGTNEIIKRCAVQGLPEPVFEQKMGCFVATIWRSVIIDKYLEAIDLNEGQKKVLQYIIENKRISRLEYQGLVNISKRTAIRELNRLEEAELIIRKGQGYNIYYVLARNGTKWHEAKNSN